jgi:hypothetical protein
MSGNMDPSELQQLIESISSLSLQSKSQKDYPPESNTKFFDELMRLIWAICALLDHIFDENLIFQSQLPHLTNAVIFQILFLNDLVTTILQQEAQRAPDYVKQSEDLNLAIFQSECQMKMTHENGVMFKLLQNRKALIEMWIQFLRDQQVAPVIQVVTVPLESIDNSEQVAPTVIEPLSSLSVSPVPAQSGYKVEIEDDYNLRAPPSTPCVAKIAYEPVCFSDAFPLESNESDVLDPLPLGSNESDVLDPLPLGSNDPDVLDPLLNGVWRMTESSDPNSCFY